MAWRIWGVSIVLAGGLTANAQTPKSEVNGRVTPTITQDHYQPESAPPPRLLPQQVRESDPAKTAPPTAGSLTGNVIGLQAPGVPTPDLDVPIRASGGGRAVPPFGGLPENWKGLAALDVAEMYFDACELDDARAWYQEVLKLAPGTKSAATAAERLNQLKVTPAGGQSAEPPLADAGVRAEQARRPIR